MPSREGDRVITLELFFDLVFVFAFTQLSRLMAQEHDALGILQALVILALLWWSWTTYGWLSKLAHSDEGVVRIAMIIGMTGMFVAGLVVIEAYYDLPGGMFAPMVFVVAYLLARISNAIVFVWLSEPGLRRRTLITVAVSVLPSGALLMVGDLLGAPWQIWCTAGSGRADRFLPHQNRRGLAHAFHSPLYGEPRTDRDPRPPRVDPQIGAGVATEPMSAASLTGVIISMLICVGVWWAYFTRLARTAERALNALPTADRARAATDAYLHLLLPRRHRLLRPPPAGVVEDPRFVFASILVLSVPLMALTAPIFALVGVATTLVVFFSVERATLPALQP